MIRSLLTPILLPILILVCALPAQAYQHKAVRLGHPLTRFAPPLKIPEDLRRTLLDPRLQADVTAIARESGYTGDMEDFRRAATEAVIQAIQIPPGALLPAMSTREKGKPVLLKEVLWAGAQPIDAYEFFFNAQGRRYRVVTPKACSNFWVEPQSQPQLSLACEAPTEALLGQAIKVCQHIRNPGPGLETSATLTLPTPAGAGPVEADTGAALAPEQIAWTMKGLTPGASERRCATFTPRQRGVLAFQARLAGDLTPALDSRCETRVKGIPAVLLEVVDLNDPIPVGGDVHYVIRVLNQGSEPLTGVSLAGRLEPGQRFMSGSGASPVRASPEGFNPTPLARLEPQQEAHWEVVVKAEQAGDFRLQVELRVDQLRRPVLETEATLQY
jgi:hypothetical protein